MVGNTSAHGNGLDVERPPHFRLSPEQRTRTEDEPYPPSDYPGALEGAEPYADIAEPAEPLQVDTGIDPEPLHENQDWSANRVHVNSDRMVRVAGRMPNRRRLVIINDTAFNVPVFLGRNQTDSTFAMVKLIGPGQDGTAGSLIGQTMLEMFHQGEVWAITAPGTEVDLSVIQEFVPRED